MSSAPSPVTVLVEEIGTAKRAIERGEDARIVIARLHHMAGTIEHRRACADAILRVGYTPYTGKLLAELRGWQVIQGNEDDGPRAA